MNLASMLSGGWKAEAAKIAERSKAEAVSASRYDINEARATRSAMAEQRRAEIPAMIERGMDCPAMARHFRRSIRTIRDDVARLAGDGLIDSGTAERVPHYRRPARSHPQRTPPPPARVCRSGHDLSQVEAVHHHAHQGNGAVWDCRARAGTIPGAVQAVGVVAMNGYALVKGERKRKVVEISTDAQQLWWLAWGLVEGRSLIHAPIKIGKAQQAELRAAGYDVKPIRFERVIEDNERKSNATATRQE